MHVPFKFENEGSVLIHGQSFLRDIRDADSPSHVVPLKLAKI